MKSRYRSKVSSSSLRNGDDSHRLNKNGSKTAAVSGEVCNTFSRSSIPWKVLDASSYNSVIVTHIFEPSLAKQSNSKIIRGLERIWETFFMDPKIGVITMTFLESIFSSRSACWAVLLQSPYAAESKRAFISFRSASAVGSSATREICRSACTRLPDWRWILAMADRNAGVADSALQSWSSNDVAAVYSCKLRTLIEHCSIQYQSFW